MLLIFPTKAMHLDGWAGAKCTALTDTRRRVCGKGFEQSELWDAGVCVAREHQGPAVWRG